MDIEGAREMIDMIDALKKKTAGNLSEGDEVVARLKFSVA